ncbi:TfuA-like protein [Streptomyces sp. NPDC056661]|uniref:TfuA-like protein n=1 Tax=Streptomyces sp. NPDC056661 TaxID=3345898 RepID=UPI0036A7939F
MPHTYVFLGPSAPHYQPSAGASHHPVTVLPPVQAGDLLALDAEPGDLVVIIDGYFFNRPAVRHKEILDLLHRDVLVHGASSMGALRAAELRTFGMIGHGSVYAAYQSGEIVGDDEVAVLHTESDDGFRPLTEALVSLRHNVRCALEAEVCPPATARAVLETAKNLSFVHRTLNTICTRAIQAGAAPAPIAALRTFLDAHAVDIKRQDSTRLLAELELLATPVQATAPTWDLNETIHLRHWRSPEPNWLTLCRLFAEDYPQFHEHVALNDLARQAGRCISTSGPPANRAMRDAALSFVAAQDLLDTTAPPGTYRPWLMRSEQTLPLTEQLAKVAARALYQERTRLWNDPILDAAKTSPAAESARRAIDEIQRRVHESGLPSGDELDPHRIINWFQRRWNVDAQDLPAAARARGFTTLRSFLRAARGSYLHDRYRQSIRLRMLT